MLYQDIILKHPPPLYQTSSFLVIFHQILSFLVESCQISLFFVKSRQISCHSFLIIHFFVNSCLTREDEKWKSGGTLLTRPFQISVTCIEGGVCCSDLDLDIQNGEERGKKICHINNLRMWSHLYIVFWNKSFFTILFCFIPILIICHIQYLNKIH